MGSGLGSSLKREGSRGPLTKATTARPSFDALAHVYLPQHGYIAPHARRSWAWDLHALPLQLIGTTHAKPHSCPTCDAAGSTAWYWRPVHPTVRQLGKAHLGSGEAATANDAHMSRFRRFRGISARERACCIVADFCMGGAASRKPGRGELQADPQVLAPLGHAWLAGQMVDSGTAVGAPTMQAGGLHQAMKVSEGAAARVGGLVHVWFGEGRSRQTGHAARAGASKPTSPGRSAEGGEDGTCMGVTSWRVSPQSRGVSEDMVMLALRANCCPAAWASSLAMQ